MPTVVCPSCQTMVDSQEGETGEGSICPQCGARLGSLALLEGTPELLPGEIGEDVKEAPAPMSPPFMMLDLPKSEAPSSPSAAPPLPPPPPPPPAPASAVRPPPFKPTPAPAPGAKRETPGRGYRILEANSAQDLQDAVLDAMERGWQPQGGIAVGYSGNSGRWWYYQAMIRIT